MALPRPEASGCGCDGLPRHLTDREAEILTLAAQDLYDREIAEVLGISVRTVQQHMASMLRKADLRSRSGLVAHCYASEVLNGPSVWPPRWSGRRCLTPFSAVFSARKSFAL